MTGLRAAWPVLLAYVLAFANVVLFSLMALVTVRSLYPDLSDRTVLEGLPALVGGVLASATALLVTVIMVARPLTAASLRLVPGIETGRTLAAMVVGMLALGEVLSALTTLTGFADQGSMEVIRRALRGTGGPDLFAVIVVIGVFAGAAEEVFFPGYMQTRLREWWRPSIAIVATSVGFGLLHLEWIHALIALALGLYLGFITEASGSALPAIVCHVVNNVLFTLLSATVQPTYAFWPNAIALAGAGLVFLAVMLYLRRALNVPPPP